MLYFILYITIPNFYFVLVITIKKKHFSLFQSSIPSLSCDRVVISRTESTKKFLYFKFNGTEYFYYCKLFRQSSHTLILIA